MSFPTFHEQFPITACEGNQITFNLFFQVIKKDIPCKWPHNKNPTDILLDNLILAQSKTEPSLIMVYVPLLPFQSGPHTAVQNLSDASLLRMEFFIILPSD